VDAPAVPRPAMKQTLREQGYDFSFLYKPASAEIGKGIGMSDSKLSESMRREEPKGDIAFQRGRGLNPISPGDEMTLATVDPDGLASMKQVGKEEVNVNSLLNSYRHAPKPEHALYPTTSNDIGLKKPSKATYVLERHSRQQRFSNSFNGILYRDQGLNTSMHKSKIQA